MILSPTALTIPAWSSPLTIFGLATDAGGGRVAAVELSLDSGGTWHRVTGTDSWAADWTPGAPGLVTIQSRAIDDGARVETPATGVTLTVTGNSVKASLWPQDSSPAAPDLADPTPVELGVRFKSDFPGWITALRFYKSAADIGVHLGHLWSNNGTLLASVTFSNETASGWQEMQLPTPIAVTAGTYYVASYHTASGHHPGDVLYFAPAGVDRGPLHAPKDTPAATNGLFVYGAATAFPGGSAQSANYWVDVVYAYSLAPDTTLPYIVSTSPVAFGASNISPFTSVEVEFGEAMNFATIGSSNFFLKDAQNNSIAATITYDPATKVARLQPTGTLAINATYTVTVKGGVAGVADLAGNRLKSDFVWSFVTDSWTIWPPEATPTLIDTNDPNPVELGVRFKSDVAGYVTGLKFYKSAADVGPHVGSLWSVSGTLLASATFTNETAAGWQDVSLSAPVAIVAGGTYVASYHSNSHHAGDVLYFANSGVDRGPVHALKDTAAAPNGLYAYGPTQFPANSAQSANYWADVKVNTSNQAAAPVFLPPPGSYPTGRTVTMASTTPGAQIYYTTNGAAPTASSTKYSVPVFVGTTTTLKAIAIAPNWATSPVSTGTYTIQSIQTALPTFSPDGGTYSSAQTVTLASATTGARIYYTTNGSSPTATSTSYSAPFAIASNVTIKAIAIAGGSTSGVSSASYTFQAATPTFSLPAGTYPSSRSITLSDVSPGAQIYYTTNGSPPTTASTQYTAPITVGTTTTINAMAAVNGWSNSSVASATYTIQLPQRPSAPGSLAATAITSTQINLGWADLATNETGYKIERKTAANGTYSQIALVAADVSSYSDATVNAGTSYYYQVRATNTSGDSPYSNEANATTPLAGALPPPWIQSDIGSTGQAGSGSYSGAVFTVKGSGDDIWNAADAFHYVYQSLTGNGEIIARVASIQNTDAWAKAGVMIRETTGANARNVLMAVTPGNGLSFQRRLTAGGASTYSAGPVVTAPYWVRLVRNGNVFTGYSSSNGSTWTQVGSDTIAMGADVQIGLAVTAHNNTALCTAVIDSVSLITSIGAPSSLAASATSGSQVNLSWVDNATNETGFKIERKTGASGTYAQIATVGANVTSYSDLSLNAGATYFYRLRAANATADSAYSNEASATTPVSPPATPTGFAASAISTSQISLAWADVATETAYKIERKVGAGGTYLQIGTTSANIASYGDIGLAVNTTYYYRLRASNASGDSAYSTEVSATTLNAAPAAPTSLAASALSTTQVNLSWTDNSSNETGFRIERSIGTTFVEITSVGVGVTSFADTGLLPGTNYLYRVRATNALGDSAYSNQTNATTLVPPPAQPTGLAATSISSSQINLTWTDVATETGFKVERKTGAGGTFAQIGTVGPSVTTFSNTGLASGTTFFYRIKATNSGGDSAYSAETSATTLNSAPPTPTGFAAVAVSASQINLSWTDGPSETGYKVERKIGAGGTYAQIATTGADTTTYSNSGLAAGTTYVYRIRASNAAGDSSYSAEASATASVPTFRAAASKGATSGTLSLTINRPAGTVQGDVMVASIAIRPSTASITPAAGWNLVQRVDNPNPNANSLAVYYKVAGASEAATYKWSFSTSTGAAGGIASFSGLDSANPVDVQAGQPTGAALSHAAPGVTTRYPADLIITSYGFSSSASFAPPSGMSEAFDVASDAAGSGGETVAMDYKILATVGATGALSATAANDADVGNTFTLALRAK